MVGDAQVAPRRRLRPVKLTVAPVRRSGDPQSLLLVVFEDAPEAAPVPLDGRAAAAAS